MQGVPRSDTASAKRQRITLVPGSGHRRDRHEQQLKELATLGIKRVGLMICETPLLGAAGPRAPALGRLKAQGTAPDRCL